MELTILSKYLDHLKKGLIEVLGSLEASTFTKNMSGEAFTGLQLHTSLEIRGILIRAGRAGFNYWLSDNYRSCGWDDPEFRFKPVRRKLAAGLGDICNWFTRETTAMVSLQESKAAWILRLDIPDGVEGQAPILDCAYMWGFVQEFTRWSGLGRFYPVHETRCRLKADEYCEITIEKEPTD